MIHYSCDMCGKPINPDADERYTVLIDVEQIYPGDDYPGLSYEFSEEDEEEEMDFDLDASQVDEEDAICHSFKYDLCVKCAENYINDPLARKVLRRVRFMDN